MAHGSIDEQADKINEYNGIDLAYYNSKLDGGLLHNSETTISTARALEIDGHVLISKNYSDEDFVTLQGKIIRTLSDRPC